MTAHQGPIGRPEMLTDPGAGRSGTRPEARDADSDPGGDVFHRVFQANPAAVRDALRSAVARFARQLSPEDAGTLELALAEVLNNVVEHGYSDRPAGPIDLKLGHGGRDLTCRVEDFGRPMPGLAPPEGRQPVVGGDVAALAEGGWGWGMIHALTEDLTYSRRDGRNILRFRIRLTRHEG